MLTKIARCFFTLAFLSFVALSALPTVVAEEVESIQNAFLKVAADAKTVSFYRVMNGEPEKAAFASFPHLGEEIFAQVDPRESDGTPPMVGVATKINSRKGYIFISLLENHPFALINVSLHNLEGGVQTISEIPLPEIILADSLKPENHKALGTTGLTAVDGHPGSYMFLAVANPETRAGVVAGWLGSTKGSGVVFSSVKDGAITIRPVDQYGRWVIPVVTAAASETLLLGAFSDTLLGLEAYADLINAAHQIKMKPAPSGYCTWYSNKNSGAGNETSTREFADAAAEKLAPYGFNFFQIDDYWQMGNSKNGPNKNFMEYNKKGPYPSGMKPTADYLRAKGFMAGLWFMPFSGNYDDPYYADKQAWFVKSAITYPAPGGKNTRRFSGINQAQGKPYETFWGGTCLDMTHPEVQAYVRKEVAQIAKTWGYNYFKIDGMWTGMACEQAYVNDGYYADDLGKQIFHDPTVTNVEAFIQGVKMVREAGGDDVFILGCNISQNMRTMGASYGLVDAMRIGPDNGADWNGICAGPIRGTARYFYNGRVWWNDPDPVYVRDNIPLEHARVSTSWAAITGQFFAFSDWLPDLSEERVEVLRRTLKNHQCTNVRPVDLFQSELANVWHLVDGDYHIFGIFNWDANKPLEIDYAADFLGLENGKTYVACDFWKAAFMPPFKDRLTCTLPPATCRILAVRELNDRPVLVGTSRHVASPILEVTEEKWDEVTDKNGQKTGAGILTGVSDVVAGEVYELRIVVPTGKNSWELTHEWADNFTKAETVIHGCTTRVRFTPKEGGRMQWTLTFTRAAVEASVPAAPTHFSAKTIRGNVVLTWTGDAAEYTLHRGGQDIPVHGTAYTDADVAPETRYVYSLRAKGWDGRMSIPVAVEVVTPLTEIVPPVPPAPEVHISDLTPVRQSNGHGAIQKNRAHKGTPLTILGKVYEKGMGVHANALLVYAVPKGYTRFVATVGLDDAEKGDDRRSIQANIYFAKNGTAAELDAETPVLQNGGDLIWHFDLPLPEDAVEVHLEITDAGDGIACDHGNWVNAGFLKK